MRKVTILITITMSLAGLAVHTGCQPSSKSSPIAGDKQAQAVQTAPRHTTLPTAERAAPQPTSRRQALTAEDNPTTRDGRGEPSLDDFFRLAAWVYVDGRGGKFIESDGKPQVEWVIKGPISSTPAFRVEAYEPLLGKPKDFACTLHTEEASDGSKASYAIKAAEGTFEAGRQYSLLSPGDNFIIRNLNTGDVVTEIAPLAPGTYLLAVGIKNAETGHEGLAITQFAVGKGN